MINAISSALSGLGAASQKIENSAERIAQFGSGVAETTPTPIADPATPLTGGNTALNATTLAVSEINLIEESVNLKVAETAYKANLSVLETVNELSDELIDSFDQTV